MYRNGIRGKTLEFYRSVLALSNSAIVVTDAQAHDNHIIFVNPAFEALTGYMAAEVLGKNCRFLQRHEEDHVARTALATLISQGVAGDALLRNYRKNGELFWNNLYLFPVKDAGGSITNFVGIQHDVTVERQLLERLDEKRRLIDMSSDVYLKITERGTIVDANAACAQVFGRAAAELIGKTTACLSAERGIEPWGNLAQVLAE